MSKTILPSGEELNVSPESVLRYLNPDGLRQLLRQERLRWHLKTNKDVDYYDNTHLFKYSGEVHNEGNYQKMEIRTFPDNGAFEGYAGIHVDSGVTGIVHNLEKWDKALSDESKNKIINRLMLGAMATVDELEGFGLDQYGDMSNSTNNRSAMMLFDPYDGRIYAMTNDDPEYTNNEIRPNPLPERTVARIGDIPTRITQLLNDINYINDPDYNHTDNNFTNSNRFILDNLDDRTFVYPEVSKDTNGDYIKNIRYGLNGEAIYSESDVMNRKNIQPDIDGTRADEAPSSYNYNTDYSAINTPDGFLQGVFRSVEELEKVDLTKQKMEPMKGENQGARRVSSYYIHDGIWSSNWFDSITHKDSYLASSINPNDMELYIQGCEPVPYKERDDSFDRSQLYQWRYNRVEVTYPSSDITISIVESGSGYTEGDILRWTFGNDSFVYRVTTVGANGQIISGEYVNGSDVVYDTDPSTHGVGIEFINNSSVGRGAKLAINAKAKITTSATQIKNNLYAYVDVTPTVASDNTSPWADNKETDIQDGTVTVRSTAPGPAYSGINSGRGGSLPNPNQSEPTLYEHGGNATAGVHVHLFRYVINTATPTWEIVDGVQVFTGKWVDQGPLGLERPSDIKALLFSNYDTNNFNNYYKFMVDMLFDAFSRNPDAVYTHNRNAVSIPYYHIDQTDPTDDRRFTRMEIDPQTSQLVEVDITPKVIYINAATGLMWYYNSSYKNDSSFGYGYRSVGWVPIAGAVTK